MALPFSFSNNTSPTGVQLDADLAALGAMGTTFCVATGTNTITLTPNANQPTVAAYVNQQIFSFAAAASSNSTVTLGVNALSALPLFLIGGSQAASGDITIGTPYLIQYLSALNTGAGGFQIISAVPSSAAVAQAPGRVQGLTINNNSSTPNTKIDIGGAYTVLSTTGGTPKFLSSVAVTIDLTTTGANGMDTGARPTSGWVYCYIINNGSATAGLATATSPTAGLPSPFPGGYSNFTYVGAMFCDGSQNLLRSKQKGGAASYTVVAATNTAAMPIMSTGGAGNPTSGPTFIPITITSFVPLTAGKIRVVLMESGSSATVIVAPNTSYGISVANPPFLALSTSAAVNGVSAVAGEMVLEAATIQWAASSSGASIAASGWEDYYSAGS